MIKPAKKSANKENILKITANMLATRYFSNFMAAKYIFLFHEWQRFYVDFRRPCSRHYDGFYRFIIGI
ncbi:hypothetical protein T01_2288 [Trichinella spiralis]|uniref:Uncharacterized protein n=1 Tax=Trichinella spiralis TaxID=6334 RepID=A0A0V1BY15_TRISP|nr:hypothetical protein T01_2288 [Trichinella spiralis]